MIGQTLLALCDPTRREILKTLKKGPKTVGEIAERFDVSTPAISRHLSVLREAELVLATRQGKFIFYELNSEPIYDVRSWLDVLLRDE
jgi:DNA-binding transcriptional ArsR family regulator